MKPVRDDLYRYELGFVNNQDKAPELTITIDQSQYNSLPNEMYSRLPESDSLNEFGVYVPLGGKIWGINGVFDVIHKHHQVIFSVKLPLIFSEEAIEPRTKDAQAILVSINYLLDKLERYSDKGNEGKKQLVSIEKIKLDERGVSKFECYLPAYLVEKLQDLDIEQKAEVEFAMRIANYNMMRISRLTPGVEFQVNSKTDITYDIEMQTYNLYPINDEGRRPGLTLEGFGKQNILNVLTVLAGLAKTTQIIRNLGN